MKALFTIFAIAFLVSACLSMPKSREEYVSLAEARGSSDIKKEIIINQRFSTVNKNLSNLSKNCLNKTVTIEYQINSTNSNERGKAVIDYHSTFAVVSNKKSEFTILSKPQATFSGPSEPVFVFAANSSPVSKSKTKLTMYKSYGYDRFVGIVTDYASGAKKGCPKNIH